MKFSNHAEAGIRQSIRKILEEKTMPNQEVKCHVNTCKFNEGAQSCTLHDIEVGSSTPQAHDKKATECDSFQEK
ncbi:MAG: DUF1540 domain-containing protein [Clostridiales bacterium]|jgi:hypothetical protein|nr:DUF1540 domain-containing protein [Clostridiales bacterium]